MKEKPIMYKFTLITLSLLGLPTHHSFGTHNSYEKMTMQIRSQPHPFEQDTIYKSRSAPLVQFIFDRAPQTLPNHTPPKPGFHVQTQGDEPQEIGFVTLAADFTSQTFWAMPMYPSRSSYNTLEYSKNLIQGLINILKSKRGFYKDRGGDIKFVSFIGSPLVIDCCTLVEAAEHIGFRNTKIHPSDFLSTYIYTFDE
jgi:hypothetical protein